MSFFDLFRKKAQGNEKPSAEQLAFKKIIKESKSINEQENALKNLLNQSLLLSVGIDPNITGELRMGAIKKLRNANPKDLYSIVVGSTHNGVCNAAVSKLNEQSLLEKIVTNNKVDEYVRCTAAGKIKNQTLLIHLATTANHHVVRESAVEKVLDKTALINIAKNDNNTSVRRMAVSKITDELVLWDLFEHEKDGYVLCRILNQVNNEDLLAKMAIFATDDKYYTNVNAIDKIHSKSVLENILEKSSSNRLRNAVLEKIDKEYGLNAESNKRAEKIKKAFFSNNINDFLSAAIFTTDEFITFWSTANSEFFNVPLIESIEMFDAVMKSCVNAGSATTVQTFPFILSQIHYSYTDYAVKTGQIMGQVAKSLSAVNESKQYLLHYHSCDWSIRLILLRCLAELGFKEIQNEIDAWRKKDNLLSWVNTILIDATTALNNNQFKA